MTINITIHACSFLNLEHEAQPRQSVRANSIYQHSAVSSAAERDKPKITREAALT